MKDPNAEVNMEDIPGHEDLHEHFNLPQGELTPYEIKHKIAALEKKVHSMESSTSSPI